jgi:hypothetical protein
MVITGISCRSAVRIQALVEYVNTTFGFLLHLDSCVQDSNTETIKKHEENNSIYVHMYRKLHDMLSTLPLSRNQKPAHCYVCRNRKDVQNKNSRETPHGS